MYDQFYTIPQDLHTNIMRVSYKDWGSCASGSFDSFSWVEGGFMQKDAKCLMMHMMSHQLLG